VVDRMNAFVTAKCGCPPSLPLLISPLQTGVPMPVTMS
jgi:hypothetical protein